MAHRPLRKHLSRLRDKILILFGVKVKRSRVVNLGAGAVVTEGLENNLWTDFYHNAMTITWPTFFGALAAIFVLFNLLFAEIYNLGSAPVANARPGSFSDLFFFSVETASTVGYGDMYPATTYGHVVAVVEDFVGLVSLAVMTGLVFARFSRPRARLIFANNPVIAMHNGLPNLMLRVANARNNFISDASAKLWVIRSRVSPEGRRMTGFHAMKLEALGESDLRPQLGAVPSDRRGEPAPRHERAGPRRERDEFRADDQRSGRDFGADRPFPQDVFGARPAPRPRIRRRHPRRRGRPAPRRLRQDPRHPAGDGRDRAAAPGRARSR